MMAVDYQEQLNYWEAIGERRTPDHPVVRAFARPKLASILKGLPSGGGQRTMLEVGAGNGFFSYHFDYSFELTALDFSANMLRINPLPEERKVVGDAEKLPFEADSFDVVFCGNLLHHLEDPRIAVGEMKRVARQHVVLIEPNAINPAMFLFGLLKKEERGTLKFTPGYLRRLGEQVGLKLRRFSTEGMVLPNKTPPALLPFFEMIDVPNPLGFYHVAVFDVG